MKKKARPSGIKAYIPLTEVEIETIRTAWQTLVNQQLPSPFICLETCFEREQGAWYLRVYVDTPDKQISLDQCAAITRLLDPLVESLPIPDSCSYHLEISSPGLFRILKTAQDCQFYLGEPMAVYQSGTLHSTGVLLHYDGEKQQVTIESMDQQQTIISLNDPTTQIQRSPVIAPDAQNDSDVTLEDAHHA